MINLEQYSFSYDNEHSIFNNLNLNIKVGSLVCLVIPSGAGKTTLFNILKNKNSSKKCLFMPSNLKAYFGSDTIINCLINIAKKKQIKGIHDFITKLCNRYYIKEENLYQQAQNINDFELAKVSLLLIELISPDLVVFDNTYLFYNKRDQNYLFAKLKLMHQQLGNTILYLTHNLTHAMYFNHLGIIPNGELVLYGKTKAVLKETQTLTKLKLTLPFYVNLSSNLMLYKLIDKVGYTNKEVGDLLWKE